MFRLSPVRAAVLSGVLPALICCFSLGCGGDKTYRVSGTVMFDGKPVPAGKIYFIPDGSKGNTGATGYADIKDGRYDTSDSGCRGIIGGPMTIAIEGIDPSAPPDKPKKGEEASPEATVKSLFPRYEVNEDLPKSNISDKKFEVPKEASKGPTQKGPKIIIP